MSKALKMLVMADLIMLVITVASWLMTNGSDSVILVFFPLTATIFITVAIMVLGFLTAVRQAVSPKRTGLAQSLWTIAPLLGVPLLGLYYATHGQNRHSLVLASTAGLFVGSVASLLLIGRRTRS